MSDDDERDKRERTTEPPPHLSETTPPSAGMPAPPMLPGRLSEISQLRDELRQVRTSIQVLLDEFTRLRKDVTDRAFTTLQSLNKMRSVCEALDRRLAHLDELAAAVETATLTVPEAKP